LSELRSQSEWLADYGRHIDNVRSALDWAFSAGGDSRVGVALTANAIPLWVQLSLLGECRERTQLALSRLDDTAPDAGRLRMQLSAALAWALMYGVGRAREAGPAWSTTLQLAEQLGDRDYLLRALWGLCINQFNNGEFSKALEFADRFAEYCAMAERYGLTGDLEFMPWTCIPDLVTASRIVEKMESPAAGVLVDALHFDRSGSRLEDISKIPRHRLHYWQICDAPAERPTTMEE